MAPVETDICVIGSELCGQLAAELLRKAGKRVVCIRQEEPYHVKGLVGVEVTTFPVVGGGTLTLNPSPAERERERWAFVDDPSERAIFEPSLQKLKAELTRVYGAEGTELFPILSNFDPSQKDALFSETTKLYERGFWNYVQAKKRIAKSGVAAKTKGLDKTSRALCKSALARPLTCLSPFVQYLDEPSLFSIAGHLALRHLRFGVRSGLPWPVNTEILQDEVVSISVKGQTIERVETKSGQSFTPRFVIDATASRSVSAVISHDVFRVLLQQDDATLVNAQSNIVSRWLVRGLNAPDFLPRLIVVPGGIMEILTPTDDPTVNAVVVCTANEELASQRFAQLFPFAAEILAHDVIAPAEVALAWPQFESGRSLHTPLRNLFRAGRDVAPALGIAGELAVAQALATHLGET